MSIRLFACGARRGVWKLLPALRPVVAALSCLLLAAGPGLMPGQALARSGVQVVQYDKGGVNGRVKVSQRAAQNVATLGLA